MNKTATNYATVHLRHEKQNLNVFLNELKTVANYLFLKILNKRVAWARYTDMTKAQLIMKGKTLQQRYNNLKSILHIFV